MGPANRNTKQKPHREGVTPTAVHPRPQPHFHEVSRRQTGKSAAFPEIKGVYRGPANARQAPGQPKSRENIGEPPGGQANLSTKPAAPFVDIAFVNAHQAALCVVIKEL